MKTFNLEFAFEKEELRRLVARHLVTRGKIALMILLQLVAALVVLGTKNIGALLLGLGLCYFVINPIGIWIAISLAIRAAGPDLRASRHYTFTSEQLSVTQDGSTATNRWYLYSGVTETKRSLILHIRDSNRLIGIPKRIFQSPEECAEVLASVRSWISAATESK